MEVVAQPRAWDVASTPQLREPEDELAFRGTPRDTFPTGLRRQLLPALHLLYRCNPKHCGNLPILTPLHYKRMNEQADFPSRLSIGATLGEAASERRGGT
jgi:hypothetical protein